MVHKDDTIKIEFWYVRELMGLLGYQWWENFHKAIVCGFLQIFGFFKRYSE